MGPVRFPPPLLTLPGLGAGILAHVSGVATAPTGAPVMTTAALLMAFGAVAIGWPVYLMQQAGTPPEPWKDTTRLVVHGPYRYSRNPIYLGFLLLQGGIPLWWGYWMPLALTPLTFVLLDRLVVRREEAYLKDRFPDYEDYLLATRRWL